MNRIQTMALAGAAVLTGAVLLLPPWKQTFAPQYPFIEREIGRAFLAWPPAAVDEPFFHGRTGPTPKVEIHWQLQMIHLGLVGTSTAIVCWLFRPRPGERKESMRLTIRRRAVGMAVLFGLAGPLPDVLFGSPYYPVVSLLVVGLLPRTGHISRSVFLVGFPIVAALYGGVFWLVVRALTRTRGQRA